MRQKHNIAKRPSGATATYLAHKNDLSLTLPDFRMQPNKASNLVWQEANMLAMHLLRIWLPVPEGEASNFFPVYERDGQSLILANRAELSTTRPFYEVQPAEIALFDRAKVKQLGVLAVFNLFMAADFSADALTITRSQISDKLYFSQRLQDFWLDHFQDTDPVNLFKSPGNATSTLAFQLFSQRQAWWNEVMHTPDINPGQHLLLSSMLTGEFCTAMFRILITPDSIYTMLIHHCFQRSGQQAKQFLDYFDAKIQQIRRDFAMLLSARAQNDWQLFVCVLGEKEFAKYYDYLCDLPLLQQQQTFDKAMLRAAMMQRAPTLIIPASESMFTLDNLGLMLESPTPPPQAKCATISAAYVDSGRQHNQDIGNEPPQSTKAGSILAENDNTSTETGSFMEQQSTQAPPQRKKISRRNSFRSFEEFTLVRPVAPKPYSPLALPSQGLTAHGFWSPASNSDGDSEEPGHELRNQPFIE